jgi:hypothetical protein
LRDLERPVGFIPQRIFSRGPIPLIAPFLKISIGAPWQKDLPCLFKIGACFVEGQSRAALMFARVRAGIKAGNPFPRVTVVRIARIDYNLLCLAERRSETIPSQGAMKGSFQKRA